MVVGAVVGVVVGTGVGAVVVGVGAGAGGLLVFGGVWQALKARPKLRASPVIIFLFNILEYVSLQIIKVVLM